MFTELLKQPEIVAVLAATGVLMTVLRIFGKHLWLIDLVLAIYLFIGLQVLAENNESWLQAPLWLNATLVSVLFLMRDYVRFEYALRLMVAMVWLLVFGIPLAVGAILMMMAGHDDSSLVYIAFALLVLFYVSGVTIIYSVMLAIRGSTGARQAAAVPTTSVAERAAATNTAPTRPRLTVAPSPSGVPDPSAHGVPAKASTAIDAPLVSRGESEDRSVTSSQNGQGASVVPSALLRASQDDPAALVLGFLLAGRGGRPAEAALANAQIDARTISAAQRLAALVAGLNERSRMPLAMRTLTRLKQCKPDELAQLHAACRQLDTAGPQSRLLEYGVFRWLALELDPRPTTTPHASHDAIEREAEVLQLLATMAAHGHRDEPAAARAFAAGRSRLLPQSTASYRPPSVDLAALDPVWPRLRTMNTVAKLRLVDGLLECMRRDADLGLPEVQLLRVICALVVVPFPVSVREPRTA